MSSAVQTSDVARDFDFWMGSWNVRNRRLRERLAGSDEWDEFEATSVGAADRSAASATRTSSAPTTTAASSACRSASSTPRRGSGRSTGPTAAGPGCSTRRCSARSTGDTRRLRGRGHVRGPADPRAVHLVGRHDADAALGAGVLGRRRRDLGDELGHGLHAGGDGE